MEQIEEINDLGIHPRMSDEDDFTVTDEYPEEDFKEVREDEHIEFHQSSDEEEEDDDIENIFSNEFFKKVHKNIQDDNEDPDEEEEISEYADACTNDEAFEIYRQMIYEDIEFENSDNETLTRVCSDVFRYLKCVEELTEGTDYYYSYYSMVEETEWETKMNNSEIILKTNIKSNRFLNMAIMFFRIYYDRNLVFLDKVRQMIFNNVIENPILLKRYPGIDKRSIYKLDEFNSISFKILSELIYLSESDMEVYDKYYVDENQYVEIPKYNREPMRIRVDNCIVYTISELYDMVNEYMENYEE